PHAATPPAGQVQLPAFNPPGQQIGAILDALSPRPRSSAPTCRRQPGKCPLHELRSRADPEDPTLPTTECAGAPLQCIDIGKNSSSPPQEVSTIPGQDHPPTNAIKQPDTHVALEILDLPR